jgi:hypothetical protein
MASAAIRGSSAGRRGGWGEVAEGSPDLVTVVGEDVGGGRSGWQGRQLPPQRHGRGPRLLGIQWRILEPCWEGSIKI